GRLGFSKSGEDIAVTRLGAMEMNARGPGKTFPYIKAFSVLFGDQVGVEEGRTLASIGETPETLKEKLKDALVFIGTSAPGTYDMRAFSFDRNVPGVEGHAVALDNLL